MKKKTKTHESDFFAHAKKVMGKKAYDQAVSKGIEKAQELQLKLAREKCGLNQDELKGMKQSEVSKIEHRKDVKISTLHKYADALGVELQICLVTKDGKSINIYK